MNEEALREILTDICTGYVDGIIDNLKEDFEYYKNNFKVTIACSNMLAELKSKNIKLEYQDVFIDMIVDRIYREISNYLAR